MQADLVLEKKEWEKMLQQAVKQAGRVSRLPEKEELVMMHLNEQLGDMEMMCLPREDGGVELAVIK